MVNGFAQIAVSDTFSVTRQKSNLSTLHSIGTFQVSGY